MTQLLTQKDVEGIRRQSAAIPHLVRAIIILAVFSAFTGALALWSLTINRATAGAVKECTTPSEPGDKHECYEQAQAAAASRAVAAEAERRATKEAADKAAEGASKATEAAVAARAASEFLSNCFKPEGQCTKSAAANQAFIRGQLATMLTKITATEFKVTEVVGAKPGEPKFIATPVRTETPQVCSPLLTALEKDVQVCMPAP